MAYTKKIEPNTSDSHQTSPAYVLTFTRWRNRDTLNYDEKSMDVRKPLVVVNDATQVSVQYSKNSPVPSFSCTLRAGDLNYLTAVHPGDFVIVNMVDWENKAMEIRNRALKTEPINKADDGFKGVFKIKDVRMDLITSPQGGKEYRFTITGKGFDEFNALLYFNPAIVKESETASPEFFMKAFGDAFNDIVQKQGKNNVEGLLKTIIRSAIGEGTKKIVKDVPETERPLPQDRLPRYQMPPGLGVLLNRTANKSGVLRASDINSYYLGIWGSSISGKKNVLPKDGFNSFFSKDYNDGNFFGTGIELAGTRQIAMQDFQNVQIWSVLKNYSNSVLNEMYTSYRLGKDGFVYPTLIIRQKPFSTEHFGTSKKYKSAIKAKHTKFLDLPRWKIDPLLVTSLSLGRSDEARINFVQVTTRSLSIDENFNQALQFAKGNYISDKKDIIRSGMKPYITSCNFDYPGGSEEYSGQKWADLVGDWVLEGHLKLSGTMQTVGIEDPICIGDNLEINDTVLHIESIGHTMNISADGAKTFRTNLSLSMGVSTKSTKDIPVYSEMDHTDSFTNRKKDYKNKDSRLLPGFSDTQDLPGRAKGEEVVETKESTFTNPKRKNKGNKKGK